MRDLIFRVYGFLVIVRALLPIIWILVFGAIVYSAWKEIREPIRVINSKVDNLEASVSSINGRLDSVRANFAELSEGLNQISDTFASIGAIDIPLEPLEIPTITRVTTGPLTIPKGSLALGIPTTDTQINVPIPKIETGIFRFPPNELPPIPIPGIEPLKAEVARMFCGEDSASGVCALGELKKDLEALEPELGEFYADTAEIVSQMNSILAAVTRLVRSVGILILVTLALVLPARVVSYLAYLSRELPRGWALMRGIPAPA